MPANTKPRPERELGEPIAYSVPEAAQVLGLAESGLRELIRKGEFPVSQIGRRQVVLRESLLAWLRAHERGPELDK